MKPSLYTLLLSFLILSFTGCESYMSNGPLDGLWQITSIDDLPTDSTLQGEGRLYMAFQRDMVQLGYKSPDKITGIVMTHYNAYFDRMNDSIGMGDFRRYLDYETKVPLKDLEKFGIYDDYTTFHIETLNRKRLILQSYRSRITMRKY